MNDLVWDLKTATLHTCCFICSFSTKAQQKQPQHILSYTTNSLVKTSGWVFYWLNYAVCRATCPNTRVCDNLHIFLNDSCALLTKEKVPSTNLLLQWLVRGAPSALFACPWCERQKWLPWAGHPQCDTAGLFLADHLWTLFFLDFCFALWSLACWCLAGYYSLKVQMAHKYNADSNVIILTPKKTGHMRTGLLDTLSHSWKMKCFFPFYQNVWIQLVTGTAALTWQVYNASACSAVMIFQHHCQINAWLSSGPTGWNNGQEGM